MTRILVSFAVFFTLLALPTFVAADIITFNFSGPDLSATSMDFTDPSTPLPSPIIRVTPSPFPAGGFPSLVFQQPSGLGVDTNDPGSDTHVRLIDNTDGIHEWLDFMLLSLGGYTDLELLSITFSTEEGNDDMVATFPFSGAFFNGSMSTWNFPPGTSYPLGSTLRIEAPPGFGDDEFGVFQIVVNAIPTPEPGALAVWGAMTAGCAALVWLKRRQKQAQFAG